MAPKKPRGTFKNGTSWVELRAGESKPVRGCHVCNHPERVRIEALRVAGVSIDKLAEQFGVTVTPFGGIACIM